MKVRTPFRLMKPAAMIVCELDIIDCKAAIVALDLDHCDCQHQRMIDEWRQEERKKEVNGERRKEVKGGKGGGWREGGSLG
eukprot:750756-Hanusia_phi.AAC.7